MHRINYIQTNIQHICNIGHWYSEKTKERRTTGRKPQGICYWGYLILGVIGKPFLWHDFLKNWELEELLEINKIINGFTSESFSLHKGESKRIKANGILVICSQYYNLYPSIAVISPATKNIEYIGGYKEYVDGTLFTFTFENDYTTIMTSKIEGVEGSRVPFLIAYQNLLP